MSLNNNLDLRTVRAELNNPNCLGLIADYVGVPDPTTLDEPLAQIFWRLINAQATQPNDEGEFALVSRFFVSLDIPAHLSCLAKIQTAFSVVFDVEFRAGRDIEKWRQARGLAAPTEGHVLLQQVSDFAGFAMTTLQDDTINVLTRELNEKYHIPDAVVWDAATDSFAPSAARRAWVNRHTDHLSRLNLIELRLLSTPTLAPEMGVLQQVTTLGLTCGTYWLSPVLGELSNLTELNCRTNCLHTIPNSITKLQNLTRLNLSGNSHLESLPALDELPHLKELDLSGTCASVLQSPCLKPLMARGCRVGMQTLRVMPSYSPDIPMAEIERLLGITFTAENIEKFIDIFRKSSSILQAKR